jgi:hypothetical protein
MVSLFQGITGFSSRGKASFRIFGSGFLVVSPEFPGGFPRQPCASAKPERVSAF